MYEDVKQRADRYLTSGYVRLAIGLEHIDDILSDLDQGLRAAMHGESRVVTDASTASAMTTPPQPALA